LRSITVGIQFCGGCNPRIDRGRIALELQKELADMRFEVAFNNTDVDIVVFLSGCLSACAFRLNPAEPRFVMVAGATLDGVDLVEDLIVSEVIKKVRQYYERLETKIRKEDHERRDGAHEG
jgi:hypothetical protein